MKKLNSVVHQKILLQAEEAKVRDMEKLSSAVLNALKTASKGDSYNSYSSKELQDDVYNGLWKLAFNIVGYHDLEGVDIERINDVISIVAHKFVNDVELALDVDGKIGPNEPKVPGQS